VHLRLALFGMGGSLWIALLFVRLVHLQVVERDSLRERAEQQHQNTMSLDPTRGTIFDRHGRELAVSVEVESVCAVPQVARQSPTAVAALSRCLAGVDPGELNRRLLSDKRFVWLKRKVDPAAAACVRELGLSGVDLLPESRRFYPKRSTAAHVLGYVGMDNQGMSGIEYSFDALIRGEPGRQIVLTDARRRRVGSRVERRPKAGNSLYLTVDETLQHVAETEIQRAVAGSGARSGVAIVMRPLTGEILAMAASPGFNPNVYGEFSPEHWRNRAVTDSYEPGSTFKVVTAAAALEEEVVSEAERIDCGRGAIGIGQEVIRDHQVFDVLAFREVIERSSNVGVIRVGQRLGRERFYRYVRAFGFGEPTGVGISGESRGIVPEPSRWHPFTLASISFGQEIGVSPLQMLTAVNTIAASGYLMRPRLVQQIRSPEGRLVESFRPEPLRRVVRAETAARVTEILVGVVENGTGRRAAIPGYRVAGKTGTAQKADRQSGGYSKTEFVASFVGFAPAERPELSALVLLDAQVGDHSGGVVAASVFASIMGRSLRYLGVPPSRGEAALSVAARWPEQAPLVPEGLAAAGDLTLGSLPFGSVARAAFSDGSLPLSGLASLSFADRASAARPLSPAVWTPEFRGLPARDAVARALTLGLIPELSGSGRVVEQFPPPGVPAEAGSRCLLVLSEARQ
jgi:cell division protein FtsI (penicillin-binding protein 3)